MIPQRAQTALRRSIASSCLGVRYGRITRASGTVLEAVLPSVQVGALVSIMVEHGTVQAEVVGFRGNAGLLMPYGSIDGVRPGARVRVRGHGATVGVGPELIGRVVDPFGEPLDGKQFLKNGPNSKWKHLILLVEDPNMPPREKCYEIGQTCLCCCSRAASSRPPRAWMTVSTLGICS